MSRIATPPTQVTLNGDDEIPIEITPNGLLQDRMSVNGEFVLLSQSGHRWVIHLEFTAVNNNNSNFVQWQKPGTLLGLAGVFAALWVFLCTFEKRKKPQRIRKLIP